MRIVADTHCHTIASCHAYSTLSELVEVAKKKSLCAIAVTDHAKSMPASPGKWYFKNLAYVPNVINSIRVFKGIELNVLDHMGNLDDDMNETAELDWKIASIHNYAYNGSKDFDAVTNAWINIAKNPFIDVIGHCELDDFKFDYSKVIPIFGENGKLVEINNGSFSIRHTSVKNLTEIVKICKKHCVPVILNSDAHFSSNLGVVDNCIKLLDELDFPEELVVNSSVEKFKEYISGKGLKW